MSGPPVAQPLLPEYYREALRSGAFVIYRIAGEDAAEILLKEGSPEQLSWIPELLGQALEFSMPHWMCGAIRIPRR